MRGSRSLPLGSWLRIESLVATVAISTFAGGFATTAAADPSQVIQTGCDTLATEPLRVKVTFVVDNTNRAGYEYCNIVLRPLTTPPSQLDTCAIAACEAPPGWGCALIISGRGGWYATQLPCLLPGQALGPFTMTIGRPACCYAVDYYGDGMLDPAFTDTTCVACGAPVPARGETWGQVKATYR